MQCSSISPFLTPFLNLQILAQFHSVDSNEAARDGRVIKGLCNSENFRSLDNEVFPRDRLHSAACLNNHA